MSKKIIIITLLLFLFGCASMSKTLSNIERDYTVNDIPLKVSYKIRW